MPEEFSPMQEKRGREPAPSAAASATEFSRVTSRLRLIEDTVENLRAKVQMTSENMLSADRDIRSELKAINSDINKLKMDIESIKSSISSMISEIKNYARKEDMVTLKKYIDLWQPLDFVTRKEVENIIKELLEERKV